MKGCGEDHFDFSHSISLNGRGEETNTPQTKSVGLCGYVLDSALMCTCLSVKYFSQHVGHQIMHSCPGFSLMLLLILWNFSLSILLNRKWLSINYLLHISSILCLSHWGKLTWHGASLVQFLVRRSVLCSPVSHWVSIKFVQQKLRESVIYSL